MLGAIFNKNTLKLVLALGILVGLVSLVYFAHTTADKEMESFHKEQKENPMDSAVVIDNYELKEVTDTNELRWQLQAERGTLEPSTKDVKLTRVVVNYFKEGKISMRLHAPVGEANEITRKVVLSSDDKEKVTAIGEEKQTKLETSKLELTKKNCFVATGGVFIVLPGVGIV